MTIGELQDQLKDIPRDHEIYFSAHPGLTFYRIKRRDDKSAQMEFAENVYKDEHGKWHVDDPEDSTPLDPHREKYTGQVKNHAELRRQPLSTNVTTFGAVLLVSLIFFLIKSFPRIRTGV
jgi:hypothetical protein